MPGFTKTFALTDAADVAIVAQTYTPEITVREDGSVSGWPTGDFYVKKPTAANVALQMATGSAYVFSKGAVYAPGEIAGYVRLPSGAMSSTFQQDES